MATNLNLQVTPRTNTTLRPTVPRYMAVGSRGGRSASVSQAAADPAAMQAAFSEAHPFAPSGSFTPQPPPNGGLYASPMANANTPAESGQSDALASVLAPGLYGSSAQPNARYSPASPPSSYGADADPALNPVLTAALGLSQLKEQGAAQDTINGLARAGAIPRPSDSPEIRSNKLAYLTKRVNQQGAQALGLATDGPRPAGTPIYTGSQTGAPDSNANAGVADALGLVAKRMQAQASQPRYMEDPVTGERKLILGNNVSNSGTNPEKSGKAYPRDITAGGRKMVQISADRFVDDKGNPIDWRGDNEKPLSVNEFLMSPSAASQFGGDYGKYHDAYTKAAKATAPRADAPAAAPAPATTPPATAQQAPPAPAVRYMHTDVQAELKKRGLLK